MSCIIEKCYICKKDIIDDPHNNVLEIIDCVYCGKQICEDCISEREIGYGYTCKECK